jgi:protein-S-isoprenylcysteine O-methyltransferase Ste14
MAETTTTAAAPAARGLERAFDLLLAGSVLSWGVLGLAQAAPEDRFGVVRLATSALHGVVALLIVFRHPAGQPPRTAHLLAALPSLLLSGALMRLAPPPHSWAPGVQALFAGGIAVVLAAFLALGRSFAVLPLARRLVTHGPYGWVRHPAYLGELLALTACAFAVPWPWPLLLLAAPPGLALRVLVEERVLSANADWEAYRARVRWRLVPRFW